MNRLITLPFLTILWLAISASPGTGAPYILETNPHTGQMNVPLDQDLWVYFSERMMPASVTDSHNPFATGEHVGSFNVYYRELGYTISSIDSTFYLKARVKDGFPFVGERVTVTLTDEVTSEVPNMEPLVQSYVWTFTTAASHGSGVYDSAVALPVATDPLAVLSADVNGDRILDLVTANRGPDNISVMYGAGDGTFGASFNIPVGDGPESVTATDLNRDKLTDLVVANRGANSLTILINNGDGTFSSSEINAGATQPASVISADMNSDGHLDLVVAGFASGNISILTNDGTGVLNVSSTIPVENATAVQAIDYDVDFDLDLVVARWYAPPGASVSLITILTNNGGGLFSVDSTYEVAAGASSITVAHLNDGWFPDLATVSHYEEKVSVLMNNEDGTFSQMSIDSVGTGPYAVCAGDFDADGDNDLAVTSHYDDVVTVIGNIGDGNFVKLASYPTMSGPVGLTKGDFDGDGDIDLASADNMANSVQVLFNNDQVTAVPEDQLLPREHWLSQNYPNPFNPVTTIEYSLPVRSQVSIDIFNLLGRRVRSLVDREDPVGSYRVEWDGTDDYGRGVATGVYLYRLRAGDWVESRKMLLLK